MKGLNGAVAWDLNRAIGYQGDLPWPKLPADMKRFRLLTQGHRVLMGRKTAESLPEEFKPLPNRINTVLSANADYTPAGFEVIHNLEELWPLLREDEKVFVIGGAQVYSLLLPYITTVYVTEVNGTFPADVFFPEFDQNEWEVEIEGNVEANEKSPYAMTFLKFSRRK